MGREKRREIRGKRKENEQRGGERRRRRMWVFLLSVLIS
jgi:hypothetical protein